MNRLARWALVLIVLLNILATLVAFGESYAGLYQWAHHHTIVGFWAGVWPLMIDTIILVGEAALFVSHHHRWKWTSKLWAWTVTFVALGVSVAANTGHVDSTDWLSRLTAALPPAALAFCMTVGLGVMKRYYAHKPAASQAVSQPAASQPLTVMRPVAVRAPESPAVERPAPQVPSPDFDLSETLVKADFKITEKSFTLPKDTRDPKELNLRQKRVRDMYDVDPDVSVNAIAKALGIAWPTAAKYYYQSKEARGLALTEQERKYL